MRLESGCLIRALHLHGRWFATWFAYSVGLVEQTLSGQGKSEALGSWVTRASRLLWREGELETLLWVSISTQSPYDFRVGASPDLNQPAGISPELGVVRLQQVLADYGQLQLLGKVPA